MLKTKEEKSALKSERPKKGAPADNIPRFCTRCKTEMTVKEQGEFFLGMPEEIKRRFAFPNSVKDKVCRDPTLERYLTKGSSSQPPKKEDEKEKRDRANQRVLNDLYGLGCV